MENNERDRKLEQWLDEALSEYSNAEPRFGLEQRVLNRVRGEEKARTKRWSFWKWMPAFAAIAAVLVVGVAILPLAQKRAPIAKQASVQNEVVAQRDDFKVAKEAGSEPQKKELVTRGKQSRANEVVFMPSDHDGDRGRDRDAPIARRDAVTTSEYMTPGVAAHNAPAAPPPPPAKPAGPLVGGSISASAAAPTIQVDGEALATMRQAGNEEAGKDKQAAELPVTGRSFQSVILAEDSKSAPQVAPTGIISTEAVTVAKETAALKRMKKDKREKERAAQEQAGNAAFAGAFGTVVRTEIKQLPAGPMQFPTPSPLSEQEKLVLAAAKKLKDAPRQETQGGVIAPVEIKDVQIAPLEAPKK